MMSACEYNASGLTNIYLLNIDFFQDFRFRDDGLYDESYVEKIFRVGPFFELSVERESKFTETSGNDVYKQELETFVRTIDSHTIAWLQRARREKFLVVFRTRGNRYFVFGSDGGATLSSSAQTGQTGDLNGVNIRIDKESVYPHFETNADTLFGFDVLFDFVPRPDHAYCTLEDFDVQFGDHTYCITK